MRLQGKTMIVTGGASGIGLATVERCLKEGAKVVLSDLAGSDGAARAQALDAMGARCLFMPCDVTSTEQWESAVTRIVEHFGALTALVNNAGVLHRASLSEETAAGFEGSWRVNCLGPFLGMQAALPHLRGAHGAAIVNTCSTGAIRPFPNHSAYGSSKWALRGLTQVAAVELAPHGIWVNAVFPGPVETPMLDSATQSRLAAHTLMGRIGVPTEIADAIAFLVSEHATFITGSELIVDGGQSLQIG